MGQTEEFVSDRGTCQNFLTKLKAENWLEHRDSFHVLLETLQQCAIMEPSGNRIRNFTVEKPLRHKCSFLNENFSFN